MQQDYHHQDISQIPILLTKPSIVFLYWDLWSGKTTLSQEIIKKIHPEVEYVSSPTYVYYNKYNNVYHFDLYRLSSYDEFISIAWEEILDNNMGIILIEWPQLLEKYYIPDVKIYIEKTQDSNIRNYTIDYKS